MFSKFMYLLAIILLLISFFKDKNKTKMALKKALKSFENILPQFIVVIISIGIILVLIDESTISKLIGADSGMIGVGIAAIIGSITLIPSFVAFPLAKVLLENGAGVAQIASFISTLTMVGLLTIPLEIKYFGKKATIIRNSLAFVFSIILSIIMGVLL